MKKWDEYMKHAEEQGNDLDVDLAWEEFQGSRKKRTFLLWFDQYKLVNLGVLVLLLFFMGSHYLPTQIAQPAQVDSTEKQKIEDSSQAKIVHVPLKTLSQVVGPKITTTSNTIASSNASKIDKKSPLKSTKHAQPISELSNNISKESTNTSTKLNKKVEKLTNTTKNNHKYTYQIDDKQSVLSSEQKQEVQMPIKRKFFPSAPKMAILKPILLAATDKVHIEIPSKRLIHKHHSKWGIGIKSAYSMPFRTIKGSEKTASVRRQQTETFLESMDLQIQVQKFVTNKLYLVSGITIGQYRSKFLDEFQLVNTNVAFDNQVTEVVIKNGVPVESVGTVYGSRTEFHTRTKYQRYVDISIPLQLGIQLPLSRTWSMRAASGFNYSLFHLNKGKVLASATSIGTYADLTTLNYRNFGLIQSASNMEVVKSFRGNLDIALGIQMKYDLNSRVKVLDNAATTDKFHAYGVHFGLMKRF